MTGVQYKIDKKMIPIFCNSLLRYMHSPLGSRDAVRTWLSGCELPSDGGFK